MFTNMIIPAYTDLNMMRGTEIQRINSLKTYGRYLSKDWCWSSNIHKTSKHLKVLGFESSQKPYLRYEHLEVASDFSTLTNFLHLPQLILKQIQFFFSTGPRCALQAEPHLKILTGNILPSQNYFVRKNILNSVKFSFV